MHMTPAPHDHSPTLINAYSSCQSPLEIAVPWPFSNLFCNYFLRPVRVYQSSPWFYLLKTQGRRIWYDHVTNLLTSSIRARSSLFYLSTNTLVFWADPIIPYSICYSCYWPEFRPNFCWIHALADDLPGCACHWRKERLKERKKIADQTRVGATT
jgi:hypothetical protein